MRRCALYCQAWTARPVDSSSNAAAAPHHHDTNTVDRNKLRERLSLTLSLCPIYVGAETQREIRKHSSGSESERLRREVKRGATRLCWRPRGGGRISPAEQDRKYLLIPYVFQNSISLVKRDKKYKSQNKRKGKERKGKKERRYTERTNENTTRKKAIACFISISSVRVPGVITAKDYHQFLDCLLISLESKNFES